MRVRIEGIRQGQKETHNSTQGKQSEKWHSVKTPEENGFSLMAEFLRSLEHGAKL